MLKINMNNHILYRYLEHASVSLVKAKSHSVNIDI